MFISPFLSYPHQVAQSTASFPLLDMLLITSFFNTVNFVIVGVVGEAVDDV
jgi:hypothetical protein